MLPARDVRVRGTEDRESLPEVLPQACLGTPECVEEEDSTRAGLEPGREVITVDDLIAFEDEVREAFKAKRIPGPVHLSGGNEHELISIFRDISPDDWVLSTYRSHYHALLHGIHRGRVMDMILAGRSMNLSFPEHRFLTSAIVGGMLPIAVGIAAAEKMARSSRKVWCFVGDMASSIGTFVDASHYASKNSLPISFVVEDNGMSCDTPTRDVTDGPIWFSNCLWYPYKRTYPHVGVGEWVAF